MKLSNSDAVALVELWTGVKMYIPVKEQKQAAGQFIAVADDLGIVDIGYAATELYGICEIFDLALHAYCEENGLINDVVDTYEDTWDE